MIYLDNASTTYPKPEVVYKEMDFWLRNQNVNPGRGHYKLALASSEKVFHTRELLSQLFNISNPMQIVFTSNGTDSLNLALKGILNPGDHVITTNMEHNSMLRPIIALKEARVEHTIIEGDPYGFVDLKQIEGAIKDNTKLIAVAHASNVTGNILPIKKIGEMARKKGVYFLVDAAQTAGVYPIDVEEMNIDLLAAPGHKGLLGPQGTGILYIRENLHLKTLKEGGTGSKSENLSQPKTMPDRFECGTLNTPGIVGLGAAVSFILKEGVENIYSHKQSLTAYFLKGLEEIDGIKIYGTSDIGVISINIKDEDPHEISYLLDEVFNISTRAGLHCASLVHKTIGSLDRGTLRFSLGYFNTKEDVDQAMRALQIISERL